MAKDGDCFSQSALGGKSREFVCKRGMLLRQQRSETDSFCREGLVKERAQTRLHFCEEERRGRLIRAGKKGCRMEKCRWYAAVYGGLRAILNIDIPQFRKVGSVEEQRELE
ncbi:hypothetical protein ACLOJK_012498 [Asimina triloba]